jgi:Zn-dependent protease with chaperone function
VNKGLIQLLENSEELMGVVAHEMIHVQRRHVMRSVFQGLGMFVIFQGLLGDVSGLVAVAIDQGGPLLNLQYSRRLEEEADRLAIEFLIQNRIRPTGLATALNRINAETKKIVQQFPAPEVLEKLNKIELLSSHPEVEKRIEKIIEKSNELSKGVEYREMDFDYSGFKSEIKDKF